MLPQLYKGVVGTLIAKLQRLVRYYVFIMYYITYTNAILHETFISCRGRKNQSPRNCMILSWSIMVCVISWCITQQWNNRPMGHNAQQKGSKRVLQGLGNIPLKHRLRRLDITEYKASSKCAPADPNVSLFLEIARNILNRAYLRFLELSNHLATLLSIKIIVSDTKTPIHDYEFWTCKSILMTSLPKQTYSKMTCNL